MSITLIIFPTLIILILVGSIFLIINISNQRSLKQQITLSQTRLHYEQELRTVEQEVQEAVMGHISQELHDNIGQLLTLMRVQVEQGKKKHPDAALVLTPVNETLVNAIKQIRSLSNTLNSDYIERNGLRETIGQEVIRLQQLEHISTYFETDNTEPALSKDQCLMAFRIFQEMINNTLKHAQPQQIHILLKGTTPFSLQVHDNGIGFDVTQTLMRPGGNGLKNMQKRALLAGLEFSIRSSPGNGCTYVVQSPSGNAVS